MSNEDYDTIRRIATGIYARRLGADSVIFTDKKSDYQGAFNFDFIKNLPLTSSSGLSEHQAAWRVFFEEFRKEFQLFANSYRSAGQNG